MPPQPSAREVGAYQRQHLEALAARPNTTVYTVNHTRRHAPWSAARLRGVSERLVAHVSNDYGDVDDDFVVRKRCLEDAEFLAFQRAHPQLYHLMTDRKMLADPRFRAAVGGLMGVREKVEAGTADETEADAMATKSVMMALGSPLPE